MFKYGINFIVLLLFSVASHGFDPQLDWKTLTTSNFDIHYAKQQQALAKSVGAMAESIHLELAQTLNWSPRNKTQLIITDHTDIANGYASALPFNRSVLFVHPPKAGSFDFRNWLRSLIIHEYTHVLHLDKAEGVPDNLRNILGRFWLLFPNSFQPSWLIEGYATFLETDTSSFEGRGQSSMFAIMMREELRAGFKSISEVNMSSPSWPLNARYLYGYFFFQFVEQRYGTEAIKRLVEQYSDNWFPFLLNSNSEQVLGKDFNDLWLEFESYLRAELLTSQKNHYHFNLPTLTSTGFFKSSLEAGLNGELWFLGNDGFHEPGLYHLKNSTLKQVVEINGLGSLDFSSQQGLLFSQPEICDEYNIYFDLYRYDVTGNKVERLTHCARYSEARWLPEQRGIVALRYSMGIPVLDLLSIQGELVKELYRGTNEVISYIEVSPDGKNIVASVQRPDSSRARLAIFDLEHSHWSILTNAEFHSWHAEFVDKTSLIFTAETPEKQFSVHQLDLQNGSITRVASSHQSLFSPTYHVDQKLLGALVYTHKGFEVVALDRQQSKEVSYLNLKSVSQNTEILTSELAQSLEGVEVENKDDGVRTNHWEISDYSATASLSPKYWFPFAVGNENSQEIGIQTSGMDALENHLYSAAVSVEIEKQKTNFFLNYIYDNSIDLLIQNYYEISDDNDDSTFDLIEQSSEFEFAYHFPFTSVQSQWDFEVAFSVDSSRDYLWLDQQEFLIREFNEIMGGFAVNFNSANQYLRSISVNDGRSVRFAVAETGLLDSDFSGIRLLLDWREYIQLYRENVLAIRFFAGSSEVGAREFRAGGEFSDPFRIRQRTLLEDRVALRGYPDNSSLLFGRHLRFASAEWRFPLVHLERTWMSPPIGLEELSARVFYEGARVFGHPASTVSNYPNVNIADEIYYSRGIEFLAKLKLFYSLPLDLRVGYAQGLDERIGETVNYVSFGTSF